MLSSAVSLSAQENAHTLYEEIRQTDPDSFRIYYFKSGSKDIVTELHDTSIEYFQIYDPARKGIREHINIGLQGSPATPLLPDIERKKGFNSGFDAYSLYQLVPDSLNFYKMKKTFSNLFFSRGLAKDDATFGADVARNFSDGIQLSLQYKRFNEVGSYQRQRLRNTVFGVGLWYQSKSRKYETFITYALNIQSRFENGGITNDTSFNSQFSARLGIGVELQTAVSRLSDQYIQWKNFYYPFVDSAKTDDRKFRITQQTTFRNFYFKFYDPATSGSSYYQEFNVDPRGVRQYFEFKELNNSAGLEWTSISGVKKNRYLFNAGIEHRLIWLNQEPERSVIHNLFLKGGVNTRLRDRFELDVNGHFGLAASRFDHMIEGTLSFQLPGIGMVKTGLVNQRNGVAQIANELYITQRQVWNNNFDKEITTKLYGRLYVEKINLNIEAAYMLLNNYVYFDSTFTPRQSADALNIAMISASQKWHIGRIYNQNTVVLQQKNTALLRTPEWYTKHSLYYHGYLFNRNLNIQAGVDLRLIQPYELYGFNPVIGQFYLQNSKSYPLYPFTDVYLSFRVDQFRGFLKVENVTALFNNDVYSQVYYYPRQDWIFRFGVGWLLFD